MPGTVGAAGDKSAEALRNAPGDTAIGDLDVRSDHRGSILKVPAQMRA
jgi:hypothetical protein